MGIPTDIFFDPAIAANTGTGTIGDPYGDLQDGTSKVTWDTSNGNWINIKAGTDEVMTAPWELDSHRVASNAAPIGLRGYTSTAGDGGIGGISGGGSVAIYNEADSYVQFQDLHLHNCGAADILKVGGFGSNVNNVELDNTTGDALVVNANASGVFLIGLNIHNVAGKGISSSGTQSQFFAFGCYLKNGANKFSAAIEVPRTASACHNIISIDGASDGIITGSYASQIAQNSILSAGGTGKGIRHTQAVSGAAVGNLVAGFSGVGGRGFDLHEDLSTVGLNAAYDNTTEFVVSVFSKVNLGDNETLISSPFAKSGSDTFANRLVYFAPLEVGNVWGGAINGLDKGAVQHAGAGGGIVTGSVFGGLGIQ